MISSTSLSFGLSAVGPGGDEGGAERPERAAEPLDRLGPADERGDVPGWQVEAAAAADGGDRGTGVGHEASEERAQGEAGVAPEAPPASRARPLPWTDVSVKLRASERAASDADLRRPA